MFFKKALIASALFSCLTQHAFAEMSYNFPEKETPVAEGEKAAAPDARLDGKDVNVYFYGAVTPAKVVDLQNAIDGINMKFPKVSAINLYINSGGGDVDAGWAAYWSIKSSAIPVKTVGAGFVASMASIMYCAGSERSAMQQNEFYLHAPANYGSQGMGKPDDIKRLEKRLENVGKRMSEIYASCTALSPEEIADISKTEYFAKSYGTEEAIKIGLSQKRADKILPAAATIYIFDKENQS
ncbi:ATP-dependent Clp protease proteolytic subunit [Brucellaceae bacterium C25G]